MNRARQSIPGKRSHRGSYQSPLPASTLLPSSPMPLLTLTLDALDDDSPGSDASSPTGLPSPIPVGRSATPRLFETLRSASPRLLNRARQSIPELRSHRGSYQSPWPLLTLTLDAPDDDSSDSDVYSPINLPSPLPARSASPRLFETLRSASPRLVETLRSRPTLPSHIPSSSRSASARLMENLRSLATPRQIHYAPVSPRWLGTALSHVQLQMLKTSQNENHDENIEWETPRPTCADPGGRNTESPGLTYEECSVSARSLSGGPSIGSASSDDRKLELVPPNSPHLPKAKSAPALPAAASSSMAVALCPSDRRFPAFQRACAGGGGGAHAVHSCPPC